MGLAILSAASEPLTAIDHTALGNASAQEQPGEPFAALLAALVGEAPAPVATLLDLRGRGAEPDALPPAKDTDDARSDEIASVDATAVTPQALVDIAHLLSFAPTPAAEIPSRALPTTGLPVGSQPLEPALPADSRQPTAQADSGGVTVSTARTIATAIENPRPSAPSLADIPFPNSGQSTFGNTPTGGTSQGIDAVAVSSASLFKVEGTGPSVELLPVSNPTDNPMDGQPIAPNNPSLDPWTPVPIAFEPGPAPVATPTPTPSLPPTEAEGPVARSEGAFAAVPAVRAPDVQPVRRNSVAVTDAATPLNTTAQAGTSRRVESQSDPGEKDDEEAPPGSNLQDTPGVVRSVGNTDSSAAESVAKSTAAVQSHRASSPASFPNSASPGAIQPGLRQYSAETVAQPEQSPPVPLPVVPPAIQQVSRAVIERIAEGGGEARLHLEPAGLGEITIHIEASGGDVSIDVQAESPEAMQLIRSHSVDLASLLGERGLNLTDVSVGLGQRESQGEQSQPGQRNRQEQGEFASLLGIDTNEPIERHNRLRAAYNPDGALSYRV